MSNKKSPTTSEPTSDSAEGLGDEVNFESALEELETLVSKMEDGELSLDESLKAFERGIALTRHCQTALQEAELKVQTLTQDGELVDLETGELDDS
jgi:exodeoxyribonuclease VII small subunit